MTSKEQIDAILRVVSNRCRNLRKAVDRARALETSEAEGQVLNEEQRESVSGIARKEALLTELQVVLKKQTAIADPPPTQSPKISRRAAKAAKAKAKDKDSAKSISEKGSEESEQVEKVPEMEARKDPATAAPVSNGIPTVTKKEHDQVCRQAEQVTKERDALVKQVAEMKQSHENNLDEDKKAVLRTVLNLFHIVDFLSLAESREALLGYYQSPTSKNSSQLTAFHLDMLNYFHVMLTSPNGDVPHHDAVEVSTLHCVAYLQNASDLAFEGTTYSSLLETANVIASCPILTERGDEGEDGKGIIGGGGTKGRSEVNPRIRSGLLNTNPMG